MIDKARNRFCVTLLLNAFLFLPITLLTGDFLYDHGRPLLAYFFLLVGPLSGMIWFSLEIARYDNAKLKGAFDER